MPDSGEPRLTGNPEDGDQRGDGSDRLAAGGAAGDVTPLRHLRAAQLRARATRGGLVKLAFGTVFLVGALAHALSPERHEQSSLFWMTLLWLMSTVNVALGLRSVGRARRTPGTQRTQRTMGRAWFLIAGSWGLLAVVLLGLLLRR
ncbi:MAG: hypothetical protein H7X95_10980 [Deltaproteobacteria bacterium]|nr:hypothetical protein [Deltaproteobacteria bacterium]